MNDSWDTTGKLVLVLLSALIGYTLLTRTRPVDPAGPKVEPIARQTFVYVRGPRCAACDRMERSTLDNATVQAKLAGYAVIKTSGRDADARYGVTSYPTYLLLSADGQELRRGTGYRGPDEFLLWLDR